MRIDDISFIVREGQMAYLPKGLYRAFTPLGNACVAYETLFSVLIADENVTIFDYLSLKDDRYVIDIPPPEQQELIHSFEFSTGQERPYYVPNYLQRHAYTMQILATYVKHKYDRPVSTTEFDDVIAYMKNNIGGDVTVSNLSAKLFMHPTYFIRKFKEAFGSSPIAYYNELRIQKVVELMSTTDKKNDEIATMIGIEDTYYFNKFFKRNFGISTSAFRNFLKNQHK